MDVPSRTLNNKINKLYERALRLVYDDRQSTFEELLNIDKSVTIHHKNLPLKTPELMNNIFFKKEM